MGTALKGKELLEEKEVMGIRLVNENLQVGPVKNIQLLFVLLDRQLLFYQHVINWAHGRRDYDRTQQLAPQTAVTATWSRQDRDLCSRFFAALQEKEKENYGDIRSSFITHLQQVLVGN